VDVEKRRSEARARLATMKRPPEKYVAQRKCPCVRPGPWTTTGDVTLYDKPESGTVAARIPPGEEIQPIEEEIHLRPLPALVRFAPDEYPVADPGAIVFLIDYLYEGIGHVWVNGKIAEAQVVSVHSSCLFGANECWGEFIDPKDEGHAPDGVRWLRIESKNGQSGWTRELNKFLIPGT
jgi:hypothetical protein